MGSPHLTRALVRASPELETLRYDGCDALIGVPAAVPDTSPPSTKMVLHKFFGECCDHTQYRAVFALLNYLNVCARSIELVVCNCRSVSLHEFVKALESAPCSITGVCKKVNLIFEVATDFKCTGDHEKLLEELRSKYGLTLTIQWASGGMRP